jgi:hypothetical protein
MFKNILTFTCWRLSFYEFWGYADLPLKSVTLLRAGSDQAKSEAWQ